MIVRVINIHEKTTNIFKMSVYRFGRRPYILCLSYYAMYTSTNCVPTEYSEIRFRILRIRYLQGLYLNAIV